MIVIYIENFRVFSDFRCLLKIRHSCSKRKILEFFALFDVYKIENNPHSSIISQKVMHVFVCFFFARS